MRQSASPPFHSKHPRRRSDPAAPDDFEVSLPFISAKQNAIITKFFRGTAERTRTYWLLASLVRHHSVRTANAMAFDFFLALVPMLGLAGFTASALVRSQSEQISASGFLTHFTPQQVDQFIGEHFAVTQEAHLAPLAGLAGWWLVSSAFDTMIGVFQETFDCEERSWLPKRAISLAFALLGMIVLGVGGGLGVLATVTPPEIIQPVLTSLEYLGLVKVAALLVSFLIVTTYLAVLYRYSIRRPKTKRRVWPGAVSASVLGALATLGLGFYVSNIARYAIFYGGLAAIVVVLLWLWLWSTAILIGAEVNIALEDVQKSRNFPENSPTSELASGGSSLIPADTDSQI
jgi:membrane protein